MLSHDVYFTLTDDSAEAVHCFLEDGALDSRGGLVRPKHLAINKSKIKPKNHENPP